MPKYTVELDDGRKVTFEADASLSRQQIEETAYQAVGVAAPKEPGMLEQAGSAVTNFARGAYNAVTGADRMTPEMRSLPEGVQSLAPTIGGRLKSGFGYAAATDDKQRQEIIQSNYPGAQFRQDAKGNTIGTVDGKEFALNKPGLSQTDLIPAALQGTLYTGGAMAGAKLAPWMGRVLGVGTGAAATSVALDTTANMTGALKDAIEMGKSAALAGGIGSLAEVAAPAVAKIYQMMRGRPVVNGAGAITEEARTAMRGAGINPDDLSDEFVTMLRNYSGRMDDPVAAGRLAQGQALPVPIQQTRGQLTMNPQQQRLEEAMRANSYGDTAGQRMRGVAADQQAQIGQNLEAIQTGLSGGRRQVVQRGQGGEMVSGRLNDMYDAEKAGVDAAYDAARGAGPAAISGMDVGVQRITNAVTQNYSLRAIPNVAGELDDLARIAPDGVNAANVRDMFEWRQRVTGLKADGGSQAKAAGLAVNEFDRFIDDALDQALLSGDDAAIGMWRDAINKNREFATRLKGNDLVGKLTERVYDTDSRDLKVSAESAANYILGHAKMGPAGKQNIVPNMKKLRDTLGADSAEWNAIREEAFMRFADAGQGASSGGVTQFSGVNFKTNWKNAWDRDAPLMSQLFTQKEKQIIDQFADVSARVTSQTKYGSNPSGTSYAMGDLLLKVPFGRKLREFLQEAEGATRASQAIKVPYREIPGGYLGGAGATAGTRDY
jgi:hypothetical protein